MAMSKDRCKAIQKNYSTLVKDLIVDVVFLSHFEEDNILTDHLSDVIKVEKTPCDKADKFLSLLKKRGDAGFDRFIMALKETHQTHLSEMLLDAIEPGNRNCHVDGANNGASGATHDDWRKPQELGKAGKHMLFDVLPCEPKWAKEQLARQQEIYQLKKEVRGRCIIWNNELHRDGGDADVINVDALFCKLGFETDTWHDTRSFQIESKLDDERMNDKHKDADAFVFVIMSHGNQGTIFTDDGKEVQLQRIFSKFDGQQCPNLIGKPKVFLIQACQGEFYSTGTIQADGGGDQPDAMNVTPMDPSNVVVHPNVSKCDTTATIPNIHEKSDFFMVYSTVPGYKSWRNESNGTWFIRDLCKTFYERCHYEHLDDLHKEVNRKLEKRVHYNKQVCELRTSSKKNLYFFPGYKDQ